MRMFQTLDLNGDGVLSREELVKGYQKYLPENEAIQYVDDIMKQIDKNNNGEIDYMGNNIKLFLIKKKKKNS